MSLLKDAQNYRMNKEQAGRLLEKYLNKTCTQQEKNLLERFYMEESRKRKVVLNTIDPEHNKTEIWEGVQQIIATQNKTIIRRNVVGWMLAAASVVIVLGAGLYFLRTKQISHQIANNQSGFNHITTGSNKAILTLANGSKITLRDVKNGELAQQGASSINKSKDGLLVYDKTNRPADQNAELIYNTITIPQGGQYQLILPDGTKVWLNSASSLKFPTSFTGKQRNVELTGEAYFEVAKNKEMPFNITVNKMNVQVLGTHFNIMSYANESLIKTTLLEGSVKVTAGNQVVFLKPGEQAQASQGETNSLNIIANADVQEAIAWKNGYFIFNNENIESIMRKISRWYDVDVVYQGNLSKTAFGGSMSRSNNIYQVLDMLESTGSVHFKINERRITVMP